MRSPSPAPTPEVVYKAPTYTQENLHKFPHSRLVHVPPRPRADLERERLKQQFEWADFEPTGYYVNANTLIKAEVSAEVNDVAVDMLIGTQSLVNPDNLDKELPDPTVMTLKLGSNEVCTFQAGIIYLRNNSSLQSRPVAVILGATALPFPFFRSGLTTDDEWRDMLDTTTIPFAEVTGERVIITGLAQEAKEYAEMGQKQEDLLDTYANIVTSQDEISNLLDAGPPIHQRSILRPMVVTSKNSYYPNSWKHRIAIPSQDSEDMWWVPALRRSWMIFHELGHHRQNTDTWSWDAMGEATVNIYSLAARRLMADEPNEHGNPDEWDAAKVYLAQADGQKDFDEADYFTQLAMLEQLRVVFGDSFYHRMHDESRLSETLEDDADKKHYFMTLAATVAGQNLTQYFKSWGLRPEERTVTDMGMHPVPNEDYTTCAIFGS